MLERDVLLKLPREGGLFHLPTVKIPLQLSNQGEKKVS